MSDYNIRFLNEDEYSRIDLVAIFAGNGATVPDSAISKIVVAENKEGLIKGLYVLQPIYHAEPIWIHPDYRGSFLSSKLMKAMLEPLETMKGLVIYTFSSSSKISSLAKRFGFKETNYSVLKKEF